SAGERLIVMRLGGSARPIADSAAWTRSRLSPTALSGTPTRLKRGRPRASWHCTSTPRASSPRSATVEPSATTCPPPFPEEDDNAAARLVEGKKGFPPFRSYRSERGGNRLSSHLRMNHASGKPHAVGCQVSPGTIGQAADLRRAGRFARPAPPWACRSGG